MWKTGSKICENSELEFGGNMSSIWNQVSASKICTNTLCQNLTALSMPAQDLYLDLINLKQLINWNKRSSIFFLKYTNKLFIFPSRYSSQFFMNRWDVVLQIIFSCKFCFANFTLEWFISFMNRWNVFCQARFSWKFDVANVTLHIGFDFFMHPRDMLDQCILSIKGVFTNFTYKRSFIFFYFFAFVNYFDMRFQKMFLSKTHTTNITFFWFFTLMNSFNVGSLPAEMFGGSACFMK